MKWTEDRAALARAMWLEGQTGAQIAKRLGVSRSSVMGKLHRLRLPPRASRKAPLHRARSPSSPAHSVRRKPRLAPYEAPPPNIELAPCVLESGEAATVLTLTKSMCRYPIGDPAQAGFAFCGRDSVRGAYCLHHASRAYRVRR